MTKTASEFRDRDIKRLMTGYSDQKIGDIIGKKRGALNKGMQQHDRYLSAEHWKLLVDHMMANDHPAVKRILSELSAGGVTFEEAKSVTPLNPVRLSDLQIARLDALLPHPDLWAAKFPESFANFCAAMSDTDSSGAPTTIIASSGFTEDLMKTLVRQVPGFADRDLDGAFALRGLFDSEKYPHFLCVELKDSSRLFLACVEDRFIKVESEFNSRIYLRALSEALDPAATA
ncbi:hypothetical protein [uncultured Litoreibacter sp.]|uniref:hypothetical protein n=1 Tax=uncultured Litoreibacter sp. TaxID=1392394 RepID=UPI002602F8EA|nr:hypothetical protein [uncultured Litoreibacter sp.]